MGSSGGKVNRAHSFSVKLSKLDIKRLHVLVTVIHFRPSLIFVGKAGFHPSGAHNWHQLEGRTTRWTRFTSEKVSIARYKTMHVSENRQPCRFCQWLCETLCPMASLSITYNFCRPFLLR
jgi:hypothetical protein